MQNKFKLFLGTAALGFTLSASAPAARAMPMPQTMEFKSALNNNLDKLFIENTLRKPPCLSGRRN